MLAAGGRSLGWHAGRGQHTSPLRRAGRVLARSLTILSVWAILSIWAIWAILFMWTSPYGQLWHKTSPYGQFWCKTSPYGRGQHASPFRRAGRVLSHSFTPIRTTRLSGHGFKAFLFLEFWTCVWKFWQWTCNGNFNERKWSFWYKASLYGRGQHAPSLCRSGRVLSHSFNPKGGQAEPRICLVSDPLPSF